MGNCVNQRAKYRGSESSINILPEAPSIIASRKIQSEGGE
jgi:hypothetical protein